MSEMLPAETIAWAFIDHHQAPVELHSALTDLVNRARNDSLPDPAPQVRMRLVLQAIADDQAVPAWIQTLAQSALDGTIEADMTEVQAIAAAILPVVDRVGTFTSEDRALEIAKLAVAVLPRSAAIAAETDPDWKQDQAETSRLPRGGAYHLIRDAALAVADNCASPEPDAVREALNEVVTNGEWTSGDQSGEWKISREVYLTATDALFRPAYGGWSTDLSKAPTEWGDYFLLRPRGIHSRTGKPYIPTIVQRIEGEFHTTDNELDPVYFGQNEADDHPLKTRLEWRPLPADWLVDTTVPRKERGSHD